METLVSVCIVEIVLPGGETFTVGILGEGGVINHLFITAPHFTVPEQIYTLTIICRFRLVMVGTFLVKPLVYHHLSEQANIDDAAANSFPRNVKN